MLGDAYAVTDGLKIYLDQSKKSVIQNMFYNGRLHDDYVGTVFVFALNGCIISCATNAPGVMHNSVLAEWGNVYAKLEHCFEEFGGKYVVDSAVCREVYPFFIKSAQDLGTSATSAHEIIRLQQAMSVQQASEWGMRALKGSFPWLKDLLAYEERGERKLIIRSIVALFNLRARLVRINQILSSYMAHIGPKANHLLYR